MTGLLVLVLLTGCGTAPPKIPYVCIEATQTGCTYSVHPAYAPRVLAERARMAVEAERQRGEVGQ